MKTKADYKAAMEYVQDACQKQEKITGADLKEKFGTSLYFLKAMIKAGYIEKKPGFKYRWRIDVGVLPIMVRRVQEDITKWNMDNFNKSRNKSKEAVVPVEPEVTKAVAPTKEQIDTALADKPSNKFLDNVKHVATTNKTLSNEEIQNEKIARLEKNMSVLKLIIEAQDILNHEIVEVLASKPDESKFSIKLFGIPIFSITRS